MKPITRKEKIIAGEELTPITREEMFLQKYGGGASGGADWNASEGETGYVKNRTHYEETTVVNEPLNITWDGNTEGLVSDASGFFYKVSDNIFTDEQIKTMSETLSNGPYLEYSEAWDAGIEEGWIIPGNDITACGSIVVVRVDGAIVELDGVSFTFPEKGLYFMDDENRVHVASLTSTEPVEQTKTVVHKLDKKFLPNVETNDIVFTGVKNDEGWYDYTCNVDYAKARKALIGGATARMIRVDGNQITHPTLRSVKYSNQSVSLEFFDITNTDNTDGVIRYDKDGSIGGGVE